MDRIATIVKSITPQLKYIRYTSFCQEVSRVQFSSHTNKYFKAFYGSYNSPRYTMADTKILHGSALNPKETKQYQRLIGCLLYIMHSTRPDIAYPVIRLSQHAAHPTTDQWLALKRILRYLKGTASVKLCLGYQNSDSFQHELIGFFDAAYADSTNRRSTSGYLFQLFGSPVS